VLGGQGVGAARVDDGDGGEQVVDGGAHHGEALAGQVVADVGRLGLAERAQGVFAQRRGVGDAAEPGAFVGGQGRGESPQAADVRGDVGGDVVVDPAGGGGAGRGGGPRRLLRLGAGVGLGVAFGVDAGWGLGRGVDDGEGLATGLMSSRDCRKSCLFSSSLSCPCPVGRRTKNHPTSSIRKTRS
jgi:hypothetical protein